MRPIFTNLSMFGVLAGSLLVGCTHHRSCTREGCSVGSCQQGNCPAVHSTMPSSPPQNYLQAIEQSGAPPMNYETPGAYPSSPSGSGTSAAPLTAPPTGYTSPQGSGYRSSAPAMPVYGGSGSR